MNEEEIEQLEKEFAEVRKEVLPKIKEQLAIARKALENAAALAEQHVQPFQLDFPVERYYLPKSFKKSKFNKDREEFEGADFFYGEDLEYLMDYCDPNDYGWLSSSNFC